MALPNITGEGNLVADPELRYTHNGKAVASFTVASNQNGKDGREDKTFFARISAWGALGENVANEFSKGQYVSYSGNIEQRSYEANGEKRQSVDVTAFKVARPVSSFEPRDNSGVSSAGFGGAPKSNGFPAGDDAPF